MTRNGLRFPRYTNFLFSMLLILSGDINLNPGPPITSISSLKFSCLYIRSVSSITPELSKPAVLQEFLSGDPRNPIDILSLTETWLPCDRLAAVLNSLTPPGYSFINSPRLHEIGRAHV